MGGGVEVGLLLAGTAIKTGAQFGQSQAKKRALDNLKKQEEIKANQEAIQREKKVQQILSTQRAEGAARGVDTTSASLAAISEGTFNEFAQDEEAANLNLKIKEDDIDREKHNLDRSFMWQTAGNLFSAANRFNDLRVPNATKSSGDPSGSEVDNVFKGPDLFHGPLDLNKYTKDELNDFVGF